MVPLIPINNFKAPRRSRLLFHTHRKRIFLPKFLLLKNIPFGEYEYYHLFYGISIIRHVLFFHGFLKTSPFSWMRSEWELRKIVEIFIFCKLLQEQLLREHKEILRSLLQHFMAKFAQVKKGHNCYNLFLFAQTNFMFPSFTNITVKGEGTKLLPYKWVIAFNRPLKYSSEFHTVLEIDR